MKLHMFSLAHCPKNYTPSFLRNQRREKPAKAKIRQGLGKFSVDNNLVRNKKLGKKVAFYENYNINENFKSQ